MTFEFDQRVFSVSAVLLLSIKPHTHVQCDVNDFSMATKYDEHTLAHSGDEEGLPNAFFPHLYTHTHTYTFLAGSSV